MANAGSERRNSDPLGQDFGPYKLIRRLGVGGMAETYEAIRTGPGDFTQRVCLKVVLPFYRDRPDFRQLFEREARLAAKLRHSNVVGVIDFGEIDGVTYMALELIEGVDLGTMLDSRPSRRLSHEHVALIGHELAAALEHAHDPRREGSADEPADNAIIHRDVSPSNVMISKRGEILLTDFGVAKAITGTWRRQSAVKGKVPYMSPEQLRAERLDGRSDLFALGVVLYEALAGQRPYQGEHDPATIMQILEGRRASLEGLAPTAPPELCELIESLLETDREYRPESANAVLELLDPFVPSPRKRRELGKMAAELRNLRGARYSKTPISANELAERPDARAAAASGVSRSGGALAPEVRASSAPGSGSETAAASPAAHTSASEPSRRRAAWVIFGVLLAMLGVLLWPMFSEDSLGEPAEPESVSAPIVTAPPPRPEAREPSEAVASSVDKPSVDAPASAAPPVTSKARPSRLSVVVLPWGDVWINGKHLGVAPLKNVALKPGRYKVSAGQGKPLRSRTVRLREGQRMTVQFDFIN